jgi:hypothetical protein
MARTRRFTETDVNRTLEAHDNGTRLRDICAEFGATHSAVQAVLKKYGRKPHPRRILRGQKFDMAIDLYTHQLLSFRDVAKRLGVAEWTVRHEFANADIKSRDRHRFAPAEEMQILQGYNAGGSATGLAKVLHCSEETIREIILRNGGQMRPKRKLNGATTSTILDAYYSDGRNTSQIAAEIGVDRHTVRNYILQHGGQLRGPREVHRIRSLDTHAFRTPTDEGLYWLGLLMADGNVMENGTITVGLQSADRTHLEKFRKFLKSDACIRDKVGNASSFKPGSTAVYFSVCSKDIVDDLARWGVVCRKTGRETLLRDQMSRHIWRGLIDGDGTVRVHKRGYLELKLYGSKPLCKQFRAYVRTLVPNCRAEVRESRCIWCFSLSCGPAETVARELYRDCKTYLKRKFDVAARIFGWI